jgi:predicted acylesterase/phospholipase RssA
MENAYYPAELARKEQSKVIARRRSHQPGLTREEAEVAPTVGLALSGGGIRSATFCLGVCQHLAKSKLLRKIDYLSTVSGGGFFGSFLGAWIHRTNFSTVEAGLPQNENSAIQFLRENGRYIAPNGSGNIGVAVASYLRGWVAVLGTLGIFVFSFLVLGAAAQESLLSWLPET